MPALFYRLGIPKAELLQSLWAVNKWHLLYFCSLPSRQISPSSGGNKAGKFKSPFASGVRELNLMWILKTVSQKTLPSTSVSSNCAYTCSKNKQKNQQLLTAGLRWNLRFCVSSKCLGDAKAAGPQAPFGWAGSSARRLLKPIRLPSLIASAHRSADNDIPLPSSSCVWLTGWSFLFHFISNISLFASTLPQKQGFSFLKSEDCIKNWHLCLLVSERRGGMRKAKLNEKLQDRNPACQI